MEDFVEQRSKIADGLIAHAYEHDWPDEVIWPLMKALNLCKTQDDLDLFIEETIRRLEECL